MRVFNSTEKQAFQQRYPKVRFTLFGAYLGNVCVYEGTAALCNWYRTTYNKNLTVKGIR